MDELNNQHDRETISEEHEEELLAEDYGQDDENPRFGCRQERVMAMMTKMSENINSVLTRLSRVEAAQGGPNAKKRRQALVSRNFIAENTVSEADKETSDSELLNDNTQEGEPSNTSAAEDEILSKIAQD